MIAPADRWRQAGRMPPCNSKAPGSETIELSLDAEVLATLVASHRRFLSFVEQRVESRDVAEEILQAALAKAVERSGDIQNSESTVAWFFRVLRNAVIDHYRKQAAQERALVNVAAEANVQAGFDEELRREVCACFRELMRTLKPEYASLLQAVDLEERSVSEVAERLGITPNNAAVRLHRARQTLRRRLEQTCSTCAEHGCFDCHCEAERQLQQGAGSPDGGAADFGDH